MLQNPQIDKLLVWKIDARLVATKGNASVRDGHHPAFGELNLGPHGFFASIREAGAVTQAVAQRDADPRTRAAQLANFALLHARSRYFEMDDLARLDRKDRFGDSVWESTVVGASHDCSLSQGHVPLQYVGGERKSRTDLAKHGLRGLRQRLARLQCTVPLGEQCLPVCLRATIAIQAGGIGRGSDLWQESLPVIRTGDTVRRATSAS